MKRNKFNLGRFHLTGMILGRLTPINIVEVLPGDTFQGSTTALLRVNPLVAPVMHPTHITIHHWFVPWRLVWPDWEDFIVGSNPALTLPLSQVPPVDSVTYPLWTSFYDYMGVQRPASGVTSEVNALPLYAYNLIFNEFYRDEQLHPAIALNVDNIQHVSWSKDRFTTARPNPQEFGAVTIPTNAATVSAETVRQSLALLRFREARNRFGSRYAEYLRYLGVTPSDARLQRPEFLGGGKQTLQFSEVLQTAEGTDPVGTMRGHGIAAVRSNAYRRFFTEHGCVMSLAFIRPVNIYGTGMDRLFLKQTYAQFWQREFEYFGAAPVYRGEVAANGTAYNYNVFGWQDQYDDYRFSQSRAANVFTANDNATPTIVGANFDWSFSRNFSTASPPQINTAFTDCLPRLQPFAYVSNQEQAVQLFAQHHLIARRLVKKTGAPRTF